MFTSKLGWLMTLAIFSCFLRICSYLEFVYYCCLAILSVDILLYFLDIGQHLHVAAIDIDFNVVLCHTHSISPMFILPP